MQNSKTHRTVAGTGSIRQKMITHKGKTYSYWEARFTTGYDPGTGKQIQRTISGKSKKEVAQKLREATANIDMNLVFTHELGEYLNPNTVYNHFKEIVARIGAPEVRFHDMRHSYAVAALQAGDDVKTVQGNLGHATAAFTLDVYGHVTDQMKEESANRMERFIQSVRTA